jgi:hypothetical protein
VKDWRQQLRIDPIPVLLAAGNKAVRYFTRRDLLHEKVEPIDYVWNLPEPQKILRKQQADGSWGKPSKEPAVYPPNHQQLVETFRQFRILVERYQFTKNHPAIPKATDFLFSFQTPEGDIRGFIGNQYATYYTGYILSLLIKAGYENDSRIERGMQWLLSMHQNDGGWTIPLLTHEYDRDTWLKLTSQNMPSVEPDRTKPFSHNWTDMVLRAFAVHSEYKKSKETKAAGTLLKSSFFKQDAYTSYQSPKYWTRFLFWWPNLLTALEVLLKLGFTADDSDIQRGVGWFIENQQPDGLWALESVTTVKEKDRKEREWVGLHICRMLEGFHG